MGSFILAGLMEDPVFVKVMAGAQGAKPQYGLGAGQAPAGAGHIHAVLYQVPTGTFDNSRGDGQALGKVAIIPEIARMIAQIARTNVHGFSCVNGLKKTHIFGEKRIWPPFVYVESELY